MTMDVLEKLTDGVTTHVTDWMTRDPASLELWSSVAMDCWKLADVGVADDDLPEHALTRMQAAVVILSKSIECYFTDTFPDLEQPWAGLLNMTTAMVDWDRIAAYLLEGFDQ